MSCFLCFTKSVKKPPRAAEGFHFVCTNLLFWCADSRFAKPRISAHRQQTHAIQLNPFAATDGISLVAIATNLCASRHLPAAMPPLKLSFRKVCPCRDGTLRVLFAALGGYISVADATFAACGGISRRQSRLYNLPFRQVKNGTFRVTKSPV